jgi:hypothetical protein
LAIGGVSFAKPGCQGNIFNSGGIRYNADRVSCIFIQYTDLISVGDVQFIGKGTYNWIFPITLKDWIENLINTICGLRLKMGLKKNA